MGNKLKQIIVIISGIILGSLLYVMLTDKIVLENTNRIHYREVIQIAVCGAQILVFISILYLIVFKALPKGLVNICIGFYLVFLAGILFGRSSGGSISFDLTSLFSANYMKQNVLNFFAFIPLGYLFKSKSFTMASILILVTVLLLETIQYFLAVGILDIADIVYGFLGSLLGYFIFSHLKIADGKTSGRQIEH